MRRALIAAALIAAASTAWASEGARWRSAAVGLEPSLGVDDEGEELPPRAVPLERLTADWDVDLRGAIASGRLTETFVAPPAEARRVVFRLVPLPRFELDRVAVVVDGVETELETKTPKIRRLNGRYQRPIAGLRQSEPFDWPEGAEVRLVTDFVASLVYQEGWFALELPVVTSELGSTARPARRTGASPKAAAREDEAPAREAPSALLTATWRVHQGSGLAEIESDSHELFVVDEGDRSVAELEGPALVEEGPLRLRYRLGAGTEDGAGLSGWVSEPREDGMRDLLVVVTPPEDPPVERVGDTDVVFVVDTSGSMRGAKLDRVRTGLAKAIDLLDERDTLSLVAFATERKAWSQGLSAASPSARSDARSWLDGLQGEGNTKLTSALQQALAIAAGGRNVPMLVVLTDGAISDVESVEKVLSAEGDSARVLFVGIGAEPQQDVLHRLAASARGAASFASDPDDVVQAVLGLVESFSTPLAWDLRLEAPGAEIVGTWPPRVPDLFGSRPVSVFVRVKGSPTELRLRGSTVDGPQGFDRSLRTEELPRSADLRAPSALER